MKKLIVSVLVGLLFSVSSFADVDLWSPAEQKLPADISEYLYRNLEGAVPNSVQVNGMGDSVIELRNFYCEIAGYNTPRPIYKCSYGLDSEISSAYSENIYQYLVQAGFESDCDKHDGTCDIDPVSRLTCMKLTSLCNGVSYSCSLAI